MASSDRMNPISPQEFAQRVVDLRLSDRRLIDLALSDLGVGDHSLEETISALQRHGAVTTLQTDKILKGDRQGYYYGDYKVLYLIGAGTFARVFRAEKDGKVVAVKVLRKRFAGDQKS